jgi:hypothetical protein
MQVRDELSQRPDTTPYSFLIAQICASLGEKDRAFEWLNKAYEQRSPLMVSQKWTQNSTACAETRASKTYCGVLGTRPNGNGKPV